MLDKVAADAKTPAEDGEPGSRRRTSEAAVARVRAALAPIWARRWQGLAVALALAFLWFVAVPAVLGPVVTVEPVVKADFVRTVVASGRVETPYRVNVGSNITGVVVDVPVEQGQAVKAGQPLVILDDREAQALVVQAEGAVAQAEARLRQLRELTLPAAEETLKQAKATEKNAQQAYDRANKLAADGYGTRAALDEATKGIDIARAQVRSAEKQVFTNRPGGSDYVLAETQLAQARASLASAQSRLSYTVIRAPRDGVLITRDVERGNVVQASNVLMKLAPAGDTQLVVQIDEKNLGAIALGQAALASADAFPRTTFPAVVAYINPGIDLQRATVEVKLRVPDPPPYLRQDMTVSVDIETARKPGAIIAPTSAIRGLASGKPWVLKVAGGRLRQQALTVGLVGGDKAEILDGLKDGDLVAPATLPTTRDGSRVRPRVAAKP